MPGHYLKSAKVQKKMVVFSVFELSVQIYFIDLNQCFSNNPVLFIQNETCDAC